MDENVFKKSPLRLVGSPCPWLVSGLLSSLVYGIYCNVYTLQCNVSTYSSLFFDSKLSI